MPVTLTDDPSVFPDIQAPVGADGRDAASVAVPLQRLANRTRQTKNRVDFIAPSTDGVRVFRTVASIAALQAIGAPDHIDGSYAVVEDIGFYRYDVDSLTAALSPVVVQPTDVIGGGTPGRWHLVAFGKGSLGIANGIAQCDATGRVPASRVRNGVIYADSMLGLLSASTSGNIGTALSFPSLEVGDLIQLTYSVKVLPSASNDATVQVNVTDPSSGTGIIAASTNLIASPASEALQLDGVLLNASGFYRVVNAGTHALVLHGSASTPTNFQNAILNATVIRP